MESISAVDSALRGIVSNILSTAICCADIIIPSADKTRQSYHNADASQYASVTVFQENDPITAAAIIAH